MAGVPDTSTVSNAAHAPLDISNVEPLVVGPPDSFFLAKAQASPGFAGFFLEDGRLQVRSKVQQLPTNLTVPSRPGGDPYDVDVRSADWSFVELAKWNRPFTTTVTGFHWGSMDIDERLNRLTATVADPRAVEQALTRAGVPSNVYVLAPLSTNSPALSRARAPNNAPASPARLLACKHLENACIPWLGGVEIQGSAGSGTLAFSVDHWEYGDSFITVSHLDTSIETASGNNAWQPAGGSAIATEVYDRPLIPSSAFPPGVCPTAYCRWADVAVYEYNDGVSSDLGRVAKITTIGSKFVTGSWPITHERTPMQGQTLKLVGKTSGYQSGTVQQTCATQNWDSSPGTSLLCQYKHSFGVEPGDSGAPVYVEGSTVIEIVGMIYARWELEVPGGGIVLDADGWFSPMSGIRRDSNPNTSLNCDGLEFEDGGGCPSSGGGSGGGDVFNRVPIEGGGRER